MISSEPSSGQQSGEHRKRCASDALAKLKALQDMFAESSRPPQIEQLRHAIENFRVNRHLPQTLDTLLKKSAALDDLHTQRSTLISFHDVFEAYKSDEELNGLIDQLITTLEKIIIEGEDHLNSRLERDLRRLLDQIKNAKSASLYEWGAWAEVVGRIVLEIAGQKVGLPAASVFVDAAKLAARIRSNIASKFQQSEQELVRMLEIKQVGTNLEPLPELTEADIRKIELKTGSAESLKPEAISTSPPPI